jgi:hypothetical protein
VAIQYSISYDAKGNPSLVKNTVKGSAPVIKKSFDIGEYKPIRTVQTDFDFDSVTEQNAETVYQSLQKYIYQNDNNSDDRPQQSEQDKFLEQSFEAAAAKDDDGKVIGGSTIKEKIKMAAVNAYVDAKLNPIKSNISTALLGPLAPIGTLHKAMVHAGSHFVDPYYDPLHESYYSTGLGQFTSVQDRPNLTEAQVIDKLEKAGIDSGTGVEDPSDYLQRVNEQKIQQQFRDLQNINAGGGANMGSVSTAGQAGPPSQRGGNGGNQGPSPGSQGPGGSDELGRY